MRPPAGPRRGGPRRAALSPCICHVGRRTVTSWRRGGPRLRWVGGRARRVTAGITRVDASPGSIGRVCPRGSASAQTRCALPKSPRRSVRHLVRQASCDIARSQRARRSRTELVQRRGEPEDWGDLIRARRAVARSPSRAFDVAVRAMRRHGTARRSARSRRRVPATWLRPCCRLLGLVRIPSAGLDQRERSPL